MKRSRITMVTTILAAIFLFSVVASAWQNGTFQGVGKGFSSEIVTEVTIENGVITDIKVVSHADTPGISDAAINNVIPAILKAQSVEVDTVSGATGTSKGVLASVADALRKAE
ncbi:MAG: FMN-binding protein [Limnochordia bacterium]|jgi:uncharacterized protein with FMN-binding domain